MGQQEWNRAVAFESYEKERNKNIPPLQLAKDTDTWIKDAAAKEVQIREFLEKHGILTVPRLVAALHSAADTGIFARSWL